MQNVKWSKGFRKIYLNLLYVFLCLSVAKAQQPNETLKVGDAAPPITVAKWLKGTPVQNIDPNKIYVVEFWATWCGPCIKNMPHLSEISRKYVGKITVIGVDVFENTHSTKSFEESLATSQKFVNNMGDKMDYNVAADNEQGDMGKNWVMAAGAGGIPFSLLIKNGKIVWKGHPLEIDSIITEVLSGTYIAPKNTNNTQRSMHDVLAQIMKPMTSAMANKDYKQAIAAADSLISVYEKTSYDKFAPDGYVVFFAKQYKYMIFLVNANYAKATSYLKDVESDTATHVAFSLASGTTKQDGLPKELYQAAIDILLQGPKEKIPFNYPDVAAAYFKMGDGKQAVTYQQQAISAAEEMLKNKEFPDAIRPDVIDDMKSTLAKYQSGK